jgi:hypothetical protein
MARWGLIVLFLLTACGAITSAPRVTSTARMASPAASTGPTRGNWLAVVAGPNNTLKLAGSDGAILATANVTPGSFRPNSVVSWTSITKRRVYYLNGGNEVRFLGPDGTTGLVTQIKVQDNEEAGFAVSPDDTRIAVSILTYALAADRSQPPTYSGMRLYVEDLQGGGRHLDIFDSKTAAEFPIGWTGGNVVIAVSTPLCCPTQPLNPYGATEYHVANPDTGHRLVTLCGSGVPIGPVETFGVMCNGRLANFWSWDGTSVLIRATVPGAYDYSSAVSPDGSRVAVGQPNEIYMWGDGSSYGLNVVGYVYGWLDADHIVIKNEGAATSVQGPPLQTQTSLSIYEVSWQPISATPDPPSRNVVLPGSSLYLGRFPTALS